MPDFDKNNPNVWVFEFGLQDEFPKTVPRSMPEALMQVIIDWAEENDLLVGGGFRLPTELENAPGSPDFPEELLYPLMPE